jgi:chorismate dehydratase
VDFDQQKVDPLRIGGSGPDDGGAEAALFIGDVALRRCAEPQEVTMDLGAEWTTWTGLPFVYALWLITDRAAGRPETETLHKVLLARRDAIETDAEDLAARAGARYGFPPSRLRSYWSNIRYDLDERMLSGLRHFLTLAEEIGQAPPVKEIRLAP